MKHRDSIVADGAVILHLTQPTFNATFTLSKKNSRCRLRSCPDIITLMVYGVNLHC